MTVPALLLSAFLLAPAGSAPVPADAQTAPPISPDTGIVVLDAAGPSARQWAGHPTLPADAAFQLRPGDVVYILRDNWIRVFRGPGRFTADGPLPPPQPLNIRGCSGCAPRRPPTKPGGMWEHNVDAYGSICVRPGRGPILWRERQDRSGRLTIGSATKTMTKIIDWPAGQRTVEWPADLPLLDGARYTIDLPDAFPPDDTIIRVLPPLNVEDTRAFAISLQERRCYAQFSALIRERLHPRDREPAGGQ